MSTAPARDCRPELTSELFRNLEPTAIDAFVKSATRTHLLRGKLFCRQGDAPTNLYVLTKGVVKLLGSSSEGKEVLLTWMYPGQCFGLGAIVPFPPSSLWTISVVEDSEALGWSYFTLARLKLLSPRIYENAIRIAVGWCARLQERFQEIATVGVEQRVAHLVLQLMEEATRRGGVELHISDEELAQMAGTTLYTVSRVLSSWQRVGYVLKRRSRLMVLQFEELRNIACPLNRTEADPRPCNPSPAGSQTLAHP